MKPYNDDPKEQIMLKAEEIALKRYKKDFYELDEDIQYKIFIQAEMDYNDDISSQADMMRDSTLERDLE